MAAGDRVVATARNPEALSDLSNRAPDQVHCLPLDMADPLQITQAVGAAWKVWGHLDTVVSNAGYALLGAIEECSEAQMARCFETNFWGPVRLFRALCPLFREQRHGQWLHVSAAATLGNYAGFGIYGAAKAAMEGVFESMAQEMRPFGVRTTLIIPGPFRTDFIRRSLEPAEQPLDAYAATRGRFHQYLARVDGKQPGDPEKAAELIVQWTRSGTLPARVVLGNYAIDKARKRYCSLESELAPLERECRATDYPIQA